MDLTDDQWAIIEPLLPKARSGDGKRGRPAQSARRVLEAALWVMRTGAPWHDLPSRYPPYQTCHRRFQHWVQSGTFRMVLTALRDDLRDRGGVEDIEGFIDGTYVGAKKGDPQSGDAVPAMRRRSWRLQTALVFLSPLASQMGLGHDVVLVDQTLDDAFVEELPPLLTCSTARRWPRVIAPKRRGKRPSTRKQDGRKMRRYRKRWKVERLFAWLKRYRRIDVRWERNAENFLGFLQLGCIVILLRNL